MMGNEANTIELIYRAQRRRVLATLIRLLGSFDAAEEAMQEAFSAAAHQWAKDGVPSNPYAWLVSAGRFRTIDRWRRQARIASALPELIALAKSDIEMVDPEIIRDDELRLIFTCCHPAVPPDSRIALTLREVCGLTTEEIARAYLTKPVTIAQRIVRAKVKIRDERIPYVVPERSDIPSRLGSALHVLYLIFNEGYTATAGPNLMRADLCLEAIRLTELISELLDDSEVLGLLALMLLHESRRPARVDIEGDIILLADQDRSLWKAEKIDQAQRLIERAFASRHVGPYLLQAAIVSVHASAPHFLATDWVQIVTYYDVLYRIEPSRVIALNRAIAIGMRDGAEVGLDRLDALSASEDFSDYAPAISARADFLSRLERNVEAIGEYERAFRCTEQPAEQRFFAKRISKLRQLCVEQKNEQ